MMQDKEKKYLRVIARKLNMPKDAKDRVLADLQCSMDARREAGQSWEEICDQLGSPAQVAADLNQQMAEFTYVKSPWRWACLALAAVSGIVYGFGGILNTITFLFNKAANSRSLGIIGGADGPTAIFVTASPDAVSHQKLLCLLLLAMGVIGFFALRKCPKNEKEPQD